MTTDDTDFNSLPPMTMIPLQREQTRLTPVEQKKGLNDKEDGEIEDSDSEEVEDRDVSEPFLKKSKRCLTAIAIDEAQTVRTMAGDVMGLSQCRDAVRDYFHTNQSIPCLHCHGQFDAMGLDLLLCDECADRFLASAMGTKK